jgi:hypothetical protein
LERKEKCTKFWWESSKDRDHLDNQGVGGKMGSEWILEKMVWGCGLYSTVSGQGPVAFCCDCGYEPSGSCATELVSVMDNCRVFCEVQTGILNVIYTIVGLKWLYTNAVLIIGFIFDSKLELVIPHVLMCQSYRNLNSYYWQEGKYNSSSHLWNYFGN